MVFPWGIGTSIIGLLLAAALLLTSLAASQLLINGLGHEPVPEDIGDIFDKAAATVSYADRALRAEAQGNDPPALPDLLADVVAARVFFAVAGLSTALLFLVVLSATRKPPSELVRLAGMDSFKWRWVWQPFLWTILAYVAVITYSEIVRAADIGILIPDSQTPRVALRDPLTLVLFGFLAVIAAPIGEEILFRGLVFGGLARWGFWPAALGSGIAFALSHADPGTFIPFTAIGVLFARLFWRNRSLWPSIFCHGFFNGASFVLLVLTS